MRTHERFIDFVDLYFSVLLLTPFPSVFSFFQGRLCEENIDDCFPNPCHQNGVCLDAVADFLCECPVGFEGEYTTIWVDVFFSMTIKICNL